MKLSSKLAGALLFILFSTVSQAQNYYVCDTGDDKNDGKSQEKPFQTHAKAIETFNKMFAGDSILFCRGGTFQADTPVRLSNSRCGANKVCTIADYGSESLPKPVIQAVGQIPFNFQNGGDSRPDGGYLVKNLAIINHEASGSGIMLYNEVNDITVENVHIEGFHVGFYAAGANKASAGNQANNRVILRDSVIINNHKQGWLGGCNDCLIENNIFENNGRVERFDHNIYIDSPIKSQTFENSGITIRGNTLTKSAMVNGKCAGSSLVVHGIIKDLVIDNNLIKEEVGKVTPYCWGIQVDPGNALDESFIGVKITNNKLVNMGNTGIACSSCVNVEIKNNSIIDEGTVLRNGISIPNKKSEDSIKSKNIIIENNTIMLSHEWGYGLNLSGSSPFIARNNTVSINEAQSNSRCFMLAEANLNTDMSINSCRTHTKVSIIDKNESAPPVAQQDDSLPTDVADKEQEETVAVYPGGNTNTAEMDQDSTYEPDYQIIESGTVNDAAYDNPQRPEIGEPSGSLNNDSPDIKTATSTDDLVIPTKQAHQDNVSQKNLNTSSTEENSIIPTDEVKTGKTTLGGGSSSGGGASSKDRDFTYEPDSQIVESGTVNDAVYENPQRPEIGEPSGSLNNDSPDVKTTTSTDDLVIPTKQVHQDNVSQKNLNTSSTEENSIIPTDGVKTGKTTLEAGSSSGGGASSKSSSSSSLSMSSLDEVTGISDNIAFFEATPPVNNSLNTSIPTESIVQESETIQNSSPSITKLKDVLQASQEDLSKIDPAQCRASANGKCLMK